MAEKLHSASIIARPRRVVLSSSFQVEVSPVVKADVTRATYKLGKDIAEGTALDESVYRANRHHTPDELLNQTGIMHLHPLGRGTAELLFLVQYDACVVFLEISDHRHFAILPRGHVLLQMHGQFLADQEQEIRRRERERAEIFDEGKS